MTACVCSGGLAPKRVAQDSIAPGLSSLLAHASAMLLPVRDRPRRQNRSQSLSPSPSPGPDPGQVRKRLRRTRGFDQLVRPSRRGGGLVLHAWPY